MAFLGRYERSVLIWDSRAGVSPMGWLSGIDICGDSLDISRDGYTLLVGLVPGVGAEGGALKDGDLPRKLGGAPVKPMYF